MAKSKLLEYKNFKNLLLVSTEIRDNIKSIKQEEKFRE